MTITFNDPTQPTDAHFGEKTSTDSVTRMKLGTIVAPIGHAPPLPVDSPELRWWMLCQAYKKPYVVDAYWKGNDLYVEMYLRIETRTPSVIGDVKPIRIERIITALEEVKRLEAEDPSDSGFGGES